MWLVAQCGFGHLVSDGPPREQREKKECACPFQQDAGNELGTRYQRLSCALNIRKQLKQKREENKALVNQTEVICNALEGIIRTLPTTGPSRPALQKAIDQNNAKVSAMRPILTSGRSALRPGAACRLQPRSRQRCMRCRSRHREACNKGMLEAHEIQMPKLMLGWISPQIAFGETCLLR